jgi:hypothetical protein
VGRGNRRCRWRARMAGTKVAGATPLAVPLRTTHTELVLLYRQARHKLDTTQHLTAWCGRSCGLRSGFPNQSGSAFTSQPAFTLDEEEEEEEVFSGRIKPTAVPQRRRGPP